MNVDIAENLPARPYRLSSRKIPFTRWKYTIEFHSDTPLAVKGCDKAALSATRVLYALPHNWSVWWNRPLCRSSGCHDSRKDVCSRCFPFPHYRVIAVHCVVQMSVPTMTLARSRSTILYSCADKFLGGLFLRCERVFYSSRPGSIQWARNIWFATVITETVCSNTFL